MTISPSSRQEFEPYTAENGILRPLLPVSHREGEYDSAEFDSLRAMQQDHFWYRGRHRFLLRALRNELLCCGRDGQSGRAVDLGGGCGGWVRYLADRQPDAFAELALADSSLHALEYAREIVPPDTPRYQCDLLQLGWTDRWDVAFLLDVLEHIPDDAAALRSIRQSLAPGGLLFVTTPALRCFWTWNDEAAHHQRRYSKADFRRLADQTGFKLLDARYFIFFLSPLMMAVRWMARLRHGLRQPTPAELKALVQHTHSIPARPINEVLAALCAAETPLGHYMSFPWGTSILVVLKRD